MSTTGETEKPSPAWREQDIKDLDKEAKHDLLADFYSDTAGKVVLVPDETEKERILKVLATKQSGELGVGRRYLSFKEGWTGLVIRKDPRETHELSFAFVTIPATGDFPEHERALAHFNTKDLLRDLFPGWNDIPRSNR